MVSLKVIHSYSQVPFQNETLESRSWLRPAPDQLSRDLVDVWDSPALNRARHRIDTADITTGLGESFG
jgi:hypothetical protein